MWDGGGTSRGTGENAEIVNVYVAWDGVTGWKGVEGCDRSELHLFAPKCSQVRLNTARYT